jgi:hypothetical protein
MSASEIADAPRDEPDMLTPAHNRRASGYRIARGTRFVS